MSKKGIFVKGYKTKKHCNCQSERLNANSVFQSEINHLNIRYFTANPCLFGRQALNGAVTREITGYIQSFHQAKSPL